MSYLSALAEYHALCVSDREGFEHTPCFTADSVGLLFRPAELANSNALFSTPKNVSSEPFQLNGSYLIAKSATDDLGWDSKPDFPVRSVVHASRFPTGEQEHAMIRSRQDVFAKRQNLSLKSPPSILPRGDRHADKSRRAASKATHAVQLK